MECGGWAFERANTLYPDVDETAVAMVVLAKIRKVVPTALRQRIEEALLRAEVWVRAMKSSNGGWGAFDKDNNRKAADWLVSKQNPDGGWGESCASYMDESFRGAGPNTPTQTA